MNNARDNRQMQLKRTHLSRRAVAGWALALVGPMVIAACGSGRAKSQERAAEPPRAVLGAQDVAVAQRSDLAPGIVLTGSLQPYKVVRVKAQVPGTVRDVRVDRGAPVRKGQVMATIEAAGIQSQAAAARANLAVARQKMEAARTLNSAGAMSDIDLRGAEAAYEAAQAQAASAEEAAARRTIIAPITGVVSARAVDGGEAVGMDAPLFTVVNTDTLELAGQIPVELASGARAGQPVVFTLQAQADRELRGRVARIDPVADAQTRQVGIFVQLPNPRGAIIGGQFATGRIVGERIANAIVIPELALRGDAGAPHVLVVAGDVVERRTVGVGARDIGSGRVAITSGLQEGERVITTPAVVLTPGTRVTVAMEKGAEAPAAAPANTGLEGQ
jgi:RND family efflux transporter MFP subunit